MRREDIITKLRQAEPALRRAGVAALYLFGSTAREKARPASDIDIFVDPEVGGRFGFLQYMDAYDTIRGVLGPDADIGYSTRDGLSRHVRAGIEREAIRIF
jgi:predicted nucleotidyltransferase